MPKPKPNWEKVPPRNWEEEQAHRVGVEVKRLRGKRSAQWLSDRTQELGCPVTRTVVSDLEVGRRRYVTISELIILARALDTAPIALLYPFPYYGEESKIQVLPIPEGKDGLESEKILAVQWFTGELGPYLGIELGVPLVDQTNFYSQLRGLERGRKVYALGQRKALLSVQLGARRDAKRRGNATVTDDELDEIVAEIDDLQHRIDDLLKLGDRDQSKGFYEKMYGDGG